MKLPEATLYNMSVTHNIFILGQSIQTLRPKTFICRIHLVLSAPRAGIVHLDPWCYRRQEVQESHLSRSSNSYIHVRIGILLVQGMSGVDWWVSETTCITTWVHQKLHNSGFYLTLHFHSIMPLILIHHVLKLYATLDKILQLTTLGTYGWEFYFDSL